MVFRLVWLDLALTSLTFRDLLFPLIGGMMGSLTKGPLDDLSLRPLRSLLAPDCWLRPWLDLEEFGRLSEEGVCCLLSVGLGCKDLGCLSLLTALVDLKWILVFSGMGGGVEGVTLSSWGPCGR